MKPFDISPSGVWLCDDCEAHSFDESLASGLVEFFNKVKAFSIIDFGCGSGRYVKALRKAGFFAQGVDGNPKTPEFQEHCFVRDLTHPFVGHSDWVLCLEVGEHIPKEHEQNFLDNLNASIERGIVLSWYPDDDGAGTGHVNPRPNSYVKERMAERGFKSDDEAQERLRKYGSLWWWAKSLMVFRRSL
jgi:SAM-dependent methyltransferase